MKTKILAACLFISLTSGLAAQGVCGRIHYVTTGKGATLANPEESKESKSILEFDQGRSLYRAAPQELSKEGVSAMNEDLKTEHYLDIENGESMGRLSFSEDAIIVKGKLKDFQWVITNESKEIAGYKCKKATSNAKQSSNGDKQDVIIAWFAPEIRTKVGPESYCRLPGLILELETSQKKISCTKVELNPSVKPVIAPPSDGIVMTSEQVLQMAPTRLEDIKDVQEGQPDGVRVMVITE